MVATAATRLRVGIEDIMRRTLAITLLLGFLSIASGTSSVVCASDCAAASHDHAATLPMIASGHHHHHATAAVATAAIGAARSPHCALTAPPALVQSPRPQAPTLAITSVVANSGAALAINVAEIVAPSDASPPGPPVLPTQLRI
jgi:hypothetical protein